MRYWRTALFTGIFAFALFSCKKYTFPDGTPDCIKDKVIDFSKHRACKTNADVKQYLHKGQTVYVFNPGHCEENMGQDVYDDNCNQLCTLFMFDWYTCAGDTFYLHDTYIQTIWSVE